MESEPAPFFANLFLAHKEDEWVKAQRSLEQSIFKKSIIPFALLMNCYVDNGENVFERNYLSYR